jgi:DNA repair exonuclease SbcCD ATPase subunit
MTPADDASLGLRDVQQRFQDSATALDDVRERLHRLADAQEQRTAVSESLERAADEMAGLTRTAGEAVAALTDAQTKAAEAFASVQAVVDGTELRAIRENVDGVSSAVAELKQRLDDREKLDAARAKAEAELADLRQQFERLKAAAGGRAMKKAGLE